MPKPTTEELILKVLKAIRGILEGLISRSSSASARVEKPAEKPVLTSKIMGL